ncbi:MAG: YdeI family protein [Cyanophyceae cyanobacterium]
MNRPAASAAQVEVKTRKDLRAWLQRHYEQNQGVWLVTYKQPHDSYLPYNDIVEECICFGWIDSLPRKLDEQRTMLYISPRKPESHWSKANKERVERLQQARLLHEAGWQKIEQAKKDGSWSFLDDVEALILPDDLKLALASNPMAQKHFAAFPPSSKRGILEWIKTAKRPETRAKRIQDTVAQAAQNIKANYYRR